MISRPRQNCATRAPHEATLSSGQRAIPQASPIRPLLVFSGLNYDGGTLQGGVRPGTRLCEPKRAKCEPGESRVDTGAGIYSTRVLGCLSGFSPSVRPFGCSSVWLFACSLVLCTPDALFGLLKSCHSSTRDSRGRRKISCTGDRSPNLETRFSISWECLPNRSRCHSVNHRSVLTSPLSAVPARNLNRVPLTASTA